MSESSGTGSGVGGGPTESGSFGKSGTGGAGPDPPSSPQSNSHTVSSKETSSSSKETSKEFQSSASKPSPEVRSEFRSSRGPSASFDHDRVAEKTVFEAGDPVQPGTALTPDGSTNTPAKSGKSTAEPDVDPSKLPNTGPPQGPSEKNFNFHSGSSRQNKSQVDRPTDPKSEIDAYIESRKEELDAEDRDPDGHDR